MKRILFLLPVALLVAAPSNATEAVVQGMGGIGLYMNDDTNMFVFPQTLSTYKNSAQIELMTPGTSDSDLYGGAAAHLPKLDAVAGLYINRGTSAPLPGSYSRISPGALNRIIFAKDSWGVSLGLGSDSWEDKEAEDDDLEKETSTQFSFGGGADFMLGKAAAQIGAEVEIGSGKVEYKNPSGDPTPDVDNSSFALKVANRNFYDRGSAGKLVSVLTFGVNSSDNDPDGDFNEETSGTGFGFGAGWHYPAGANTTVILGIEPFGFVTMENTENRANGDEDVDTDTTITLPSLFFAIEGVIADWLHGRAGVAQSNRRNTSKSEFTPDGGETSTSEVSWSESDVNFSFGLSVLLGDHFTVDGVFNDQYLFNGPHFFSGVETGMPVMTKVSVNGTW